MLEPSSPHRCPKCANVMVAAERQPEVSSDALPRSIPVWRCHTCAIDRPRLESPPRLTEERLPLPESVTGLYWSARGHVLCGDHAMEIAAEEWTKARWVATPATTRLPLQCEQCSPQRNPVTRAPRLQKVVASASPS